MEEGREEGSMQPDGMEEEEEEGLEEGVRWWGGQVGAGA